MHLKEHTTLQRGRYSIIRTIGQGGFGITYLATQAGLNRKVVIKEFFMNDYCSREHDTLRVTMGTDGSRSMIVRFRDKFIKEARNIAELDHPNIVRVIDIFEENNTAYYVMEYHAGGSLASSINKGIPMSEKEALHYIRQVASALKYIHSCNMMHLDIKPDNILVNSRNEAVLIDFGLSKHYDNDGKASTTTPIGLSHGYAPIEQYDNGSGNVFAPTMDIYSLGATLCALLIGETPPRASTIISYGLPEFPDAVSNATRLAIDKAMSAKPTDRPQSVDEFLSLLDAPIGGSRVTEPMNKSASSRATEPMNKGNNSGNNSGNIKKPFNWKVPVAIAAAILCVLFAGVGINEYNDYRAEQHYNDSVVAVKRYNDSIVTAIKHYNDSIKDVRQKHLTALEKARQNSIATAERAAQIAADEKRRNDSIANLPGKLYVTTTPVGAVVAVDGKRIGTTPINAYELKKGSYTVKITKEGYTGYSTKVAIYSNEPANINTTLEASVEEQPKSGSEINKDANIVIEEVVEEETIYQVVEQQPEFPGGMQALMKFLRDNIQYPRISRENNSQGKAYVNFVVNTDGSIQDVEVMKSSSDVYLDREAVRVVKSMPNWNPGKNKGKVVRVHFTLPVTFRLQ